MKPYECRGVEIPMTFLAIFQLIFYFIECWLLLHRLRPTIFKACFSLEVILLGMSSCRMGLSEITVQIHCFGWGPNSCIHIGAQLLEMITFSIMISCFDACDFGLRTRVGVLGFCTLWALSNSIRTKYTDRGNKWPSEDLALDLIVIKAQPKEQFIAGAFVLAVILGKMMLKITLFRQQFALVSFPGEMAYVHKETGRDLEDNEVKELLEKLEAEGPRSRTSKEVRPIDEDND